MIADRQTHLQTDTVITIPRSPIGGGVTTQTATTMVTVVMILRLYCVDFIVVTAEVCALLSAF